MPLGYAHNSDRHLSVDTLGIALASSRTGAASDECQADVGCYWQRTAWVRPESDFEECPDG
ncbi:Hypothetical protein PFR_JS12-3_7 [Propionibacterium freudenreichii]|nr:Hypothetical protein PFR_JS12-3_7 [Propionibacterium freudenreichii]